MYKKLLSISLLFCVTSAPYLNISAMEGDGEGQVLNPGKTPLSLPKTESPKSAFTSLNNIKQVQNFLRDSGRFTNKNLLNQVKNQALNQALFALYYQNPDSTVSFDFILGAVANIYNQDSQDYLNIKQIIFEDMKKVRESRKLHMDAASSTTNQSGNQGGSTTSSLKTGKGEFVNEYSEDETESYSEQDIQEVIDYISNYPNVKNMDLAVHNIDLQNYLALAYNNPELDDHSNKIREILRSHCDYSTYLQVCRALSSQLTNLIKAEKEKKATGRSGQGDKTGSSKIASVVSWKNGAIAGGLVAGVAFKDELKDLFNNTFNKVKNAVIGTKDMTVRGIKRVKDTAVDIKNGDFSRKKAALIGGVAAGATGAYAYNKKSGGNLIKLLNILQANFIKSVKEQNRLQKLVSDLQADLNSGKNYVNGFFTDAKGNRDYTNIYKAIVGITAVAVICKLIANYRKANKESAAEQLLISFDDVNNSSNPDLINLENKLLAGIVSGDANSLRSVRETASELLSAEQLENLDEEIARLQNNN